MCIGDEESIMPVSRRSLLIAGAAGTAAGPLAAAATTPAAAAPETHGGAGTGGVPRTVPLLDGWRFALVNPSAATDPTGAYEHAADPSYDDSNWRRVSVPHDWSIELTPTTGDNTSSGTGFLPGGLGWYRLGFTLPAAAAGKRISVEFDGVYMDSYVHCNGTLVGNHPYGYTGFAFDLTDLVHPDGRSTDLLAVEVRNQLPSSRWYSGSGIYRHARLVITDPVHVARWGTYVTTPDPTTARVRTTVANETASAAAVRVVSTVLDAAGHQVGTAAATVTVPAGGRADALSDVTVRAARRWSLEDPYLHTVRTDVRVGGRVVDGCRTTFGFRTVTLDPDTGFALNGRHAKLYGVDLHHDQGALGSAISYDAVLRQLTILKGMGVNAFRTSHNPPSPEMVAACERLGIVMMVEAFDCWHSGKTTYDYHRFFDTWSDADITEMVLAARNSPAVVMWSIGNEIPDSTSALGLTIADRLIADVKAADASRPVVIGSDKYRSLPAAGSPADLMLAKLDGLGLNYNTAASVDALHARYPHLFLFESESSSETSTRGVYQEPEHLNTGENHTPGRRGTSSYDNNLASWTISGEYGLKKDRDRRYFAGQFLWSGFDYLGEPTPYDVFPVKCSFFGAVDTAGFAKDAYHLFRSQWSAAPMVHLVPMDWTDHAPGEPVQVWAYSTVDTVELFLNGRSLGARSFDVKTTVDGRRYLETTEPTHDDRTVTGGPYPGSYTSPNGSAGKLHLTWTVPFAPGTLRAVARRGGAEVARDELRTAGPAHALRLTPDRSEVDADGRSLAYLTAEVVDAHGVPVPSAANLVELRVTGGTLAGVDNGRQESAERYQANSRTAFNGKALAIVRAGTSPGPLTVTAASDGLRPATVTLHARHTTAAASPTSPSLALPTTPTPPGAAGSYDPNGPAGAAGPLIPGLPPANSGARSAATGPQADASYSGRPDTLPAAMLDGDPTTGWSNAFVKSATALLPAFNGARPSDWVSVAWPTAATVRTASLSFTVDATHARPAALAVDRWDGHRFTPVSNLTVAWATTSDAPTTVTFAPTTTTRLRVTATSSAPGSPAGHVRVTTLTVPGAW
jgi:beta-galactosidase